MAEAIRIGVTGHRWYDDADGVAERVDDVLDEIVRHHQRPLQVWSALAEGADRLVVRRAERRPDTTVVAVLPLEPDDYVRDFATGSSVDEFHELVAGAIDVRVTGPDASGTRESAYERAGHAVVDHTELLVAIWDGEGARGQGGTGAIVERARSNPGSEVVVIAVTRSQDAP